MIKKPQDKKKKPTSTANLFFKVNDKNDKINLKFALNMFVPKPTNSILSTPKNNEPLRTCKPVAMSKPKVPKKSVKENGYQTCFVSSNHSYVSTPFAC